MTHSNGVTPGALVPVTNPWDELMLKSPSNAVRTQDRKTPAPLCAVLPLQMLSQVLQLTAPAWGSQGAINVLCCSDFSLSDCFHISTGAFSCL